MAKNHFIDEEIIIAGMQGENYYGGVTELNFPRLKTAATMQSLLIISCVVAAVFNRGQLKSSSATPSST
ncbi:MAG: hypothetical protein BHV69_08425 [Bacteroidales bacterium 52_46]|nr:MAG: hypothetical protein BHV69_08425 [Bacteroidales bacterium 52_46]